MARILAFFGIFCARSGVDFCGGCLPSEGLVGTRGARSARIWIWFSALDLLPPFDAAVA
ncbi:MAG: hypothetical protein AB7S56_08810 [Halothiobacillaceae bacterium]